MRYFDLVVSAVSYASMGLELVQLMLRILLRHDSVSAIEPRPEVACCHLTVK